MSSISFMSPSEEGLHRLSSLDPGSRGVVVRVSGRHPSRADRLAALGVTPGASIRVLQRFPAVVFQCDQTELVVEPAVARAIMVRMDEPAQVVDRGAGASHRP
jgi:Fe2+ transport system protein FeoA